MTAVLSADAAAQHQDFLNDYLKTKEIDTIFVEIVKNLIQDQPDNPIGYMIEYLAKAYPRDAADALAKLAPAGEAAPKKIISSGLMNGGGEDEDYDLPDSEEEDDDADYMDDEAFFSAKKIDPKKKRGTISSGTAKVEENWVPPVYKKEPAEEAYLLAELSNLIFTKDLTKKEKMVLVQAFRMMEYGEGEAIITQGEMGDVFYIMAESGGVCDITVEGVGKVMEIPTADGRRFFGELALLYDAPRAATCSATGGGVRCWGLDRNTFKAIMMDTGVKKRILYSSFLKNVPILATLEDKERDFLTDAIMAKDVPSGTEILTEGQMGDVFYIIESGKVRCTKAIGGEAKQVADDKGSGDYFGELSLLTDQPRAATVTALEETALLTINRADFSKVLGSLKKILEKNKEAYAKYVLGDL